jgi:hypothetical protein
MVMRFILSLILADALMDSQGFVVVGIRESSGGSELMSAAIDWLEEQNADAGSPMYDKLILNRLRSPCSFSFIEKQFFYRTGIRNQGEVSPGVTVKGTGDGGGKSESSAVSRRSVVDTVGAVVGQGIG